jgi:hypothetical protein
MNRCEDNLAMPVESTVAKACDRPDGVGSVHDVAPVGPEADGREVVNMAAWRAPVRTYARR